MVQYIEEFLAKKLIEQSSPGGLEKFMRIALVNPIANSDGGYHTIGTKIPQLGLQVLANLVPPEHEVDIIDEMFGSDRTEEFLLSGKYDLVGMTSYTTSAMRAYELARFCKDNGIRCIMGGPHVWAMPDEAAEYFDSIALGECDEIWPGIVADAAAGKLKQRYQGSLADLSAGYGAARQSLQPINGKYDVACIQTSRGCPIGCEYCSVTKFNGKKIRRRPIADIVAEWNSIDKKFVFVVDDNFYGVGPKHAAQASEILKAIIKHGKKRLWFSQTSINMGEDIETMKLAYKAGCRAMLVGIESFNPDNLKQWNKGLNHNLLERYKEMIDGFHKAGVAVMGCFVIGGDADDENTVADTALKAVRIGVDIIQITNLTPLPGTKLFDRYLADGRLIATDFPREWERYSFIETVYHPKGMTAQHLDETIFELRKFASIRKSWPLKRALKSLWWTKSLTTTAFVYGMNKGFAQIASSLVARDEQRFKDLQISPERAAKIDLSFALCSGKSED